MSINLVENIIMSEYQACQHVSSMSYQHVSSMAYQHVNKSCSDLSLFQNVHVLAKISSMCTAIAEAWARLDQGDLLRLLSICLLLLLLLSVVQCLLFKVIYCFYCLIVI